MNFDLSDDQKALKEIARKFVQAELPDLAREIDDTAEPVSHDWLKRYGDMGFLGVKRQPNQKCCAFARFGSTQKYG